MGDLLSAGGIFTAPLPTGDQRTFVLPDPSLTFPATFARNALTDGSRVAFSEVTVDKNDIRTRPFSFSEIYEDARRAASALASSNVVPGDRVLLCLERTSSFLSFFLGAQAVGAIPVPLPSHPESGAPNAFHDRVHSVAADCEPRALVIDSSPETEPSTGLGFGIATLSASALLGPEAPGRRGTSPFRLDRAFREIAFIQYTSGSTGSPKGVVVTHHNLVANMRAIAEAAQFSSNDSLLSWLPIYHDMGLIGGLLIGIYTRIPTYTMTTRTFVSRPDAWLRSMSHFRATMSGAPNFAYAMLSRRLPKKALVGLDLSNWRIAFNGAEPIDRATIDAFTAQFASAGFSPGSMRPVYGMAESTLAITFSRPGEAPRYECVDRDILARERRAESVNESSASTLCLVSVGTAVPNHEIHILDPDGDGELPERHVGEVAVHGPSVTPYYFDKEGRHPEARAVLRTGDLGYVANGELYVVDRLKDILILAGRNIVPSDVERIVSGVEGVHDGSAVAFAVRGSEGTDELCVAAGVDPGAQEGDVGRTVRVAIFEHFHVFPRDVVLVKPSVIPRTSSGKIRRTKCKELYERGSLGRRPYAEELRDRADASPT